MYKQGLMDHPAFWPVVIAAGLLAAALAFRHFRRGQPAAKDNRLTLRILVGLFRGKAWAWKEFEELPSRPPAPSPRDERLTALIDERIAAATGVRPK